MLSHCGLWLWEHTARSPQLRRGGGSEKASQNGSFITCLWRASSRSLSGGLRRRPGGRNKWSITYSWGWRKLVEVECKLRGRRGCRSFQEMWLGRCAGARWWGSLWTSWRSSAFILKTVGAVEGFEVTGSNWHVRNVILASLGETVQAGAVVEAGDGGVLDQERGRVFFTFLLSGPA